MAKKEDKEKELKQDISKLEHELSYLQRENKSLKGKRLDEEKLIAQFKDSLIRLKPEKPYVPKKINYSQHSGQELVLLFSDCQIGEKIDYEETPFGEYNSDIFRKRLNLLYDGVIGITERHRKDTPINKLNIFMLGDIVDGEKIFRGQSARVDSNVVDQFFTGAESISNFLHSLENHYQKIHVSCVAGNHGRVDEKKDSNKFYVNWDYLIYKTIQEKFKGHKNITFHVPKTWFNIEEVSGWKFYITHGDDIQRYMQIPWYGLERYDGKEMKLMQSIDKTYDYLCVGHLHVPFQWDAAVGERFCNGSFSSGNHFAAKKLQASTRPTQLMFGVHPERGVSFRYLLRLDSKKRLDTF
ncbi:MAG: hypothetical protein PHQ66_03135 [Candidatus Nanoarchaeia archaeon]|nr:hypothetical protein [Candidatus Nanoarchaeia archaeon]MDD5357639.1 hypothetical protein [Candidatus Nanoarchaeia archaeon]MDD5588558.1 hypothetical protein [Candidatus Nanoarchaeia archaeon]